MTVKEMKAWIDNATYEQLLGKWRFTPTGSPWFARDTGMGDYYSKAIAAKQKEVGNAECVRASKAIGWD